MSAAIIFPVCIVFHHLSDLYSIKPVCHKWTFRFFPNPFYLKSNSATLLSLSSNFLPAFLSLQKKKKKELFLLTHRENRGHYIEILSISCLPISIMFTFEVFFFFKSGRCEIKHFKPEKKISCFSFISCFKLHQYQTANSSENLHVLSCLCTFVEAIPTPILGWLGNPLLTFPIQVWMSYKRELISCCRMICLYLAPLPPSYLLCWFELCLQVCVPIGL